MTREEEEEEEAMKALKAASAWVGAVAAGLAALTALHAGFIVPAILEEAHGEIEKSVERHAQTVHTRGVPRSEFVTAVGAMQQQLTRIENRLDKVLERK